MNKHQDFTCVMDPLLDPPMGGLYLCAMRASNIVTLIQEKNIHLVIAVMSNDQNLSKLREKMPKLDIKNFPIEDIEFADLSKYFFDISFKINSKLTMGQNVLLISQRGISRSPAAFASYLMIYRKLTYDEAIFHVKDKLKKMNINPGFLNQLAQLDILMKTRFTLGQIA